MTNKLSQKELLDWLQTLRDSYADSMMYDEEGSEQAINQIRKLIQRKVKREWIEKWAMLMQGYEIAEDVYIDLSRMLKELGIEVED